MALTKKSTTKPSADFDKADAFVNLSLVDANGEKHSMNKGLPLHVKQWLNKQMIEAAKQNPDIEFKFVGTITLVVPDEERKQIAFA